MERDRSGILEPPSPGVLKRFILGVIIGVAALTPGVSGGVIAAAVGLYEPMIGALNSLVRDFRRSFSYILPIGLGLLCGVALFVAFMGPLVQYYEDSVIYVFLGLVLGSIPSMVREAHEGGARFRARYLIAALIAFLAAISELFFQVDIFSYSGEFGMWRTLFYGAVISFGMIVPGISTSFLLMAFGAYGDLLAILHKLPSVVVTWFTGGYDSFGQALAAMDFMVLLWLGIGFLVTSLAIIKLVGYLFRRHRQYAYYAVLGFLAGSMVQVFPGFRPGWGAGADILLFVVSAAASYWLLRLGTRTTSRESGT